MPQTFISGQSLSAFLTVSTVSSGLSKRELTPGLISDLLKPLLQNLHCMLQVGLTGRWILPYLKWASPPRQGCTFDKCWKFLPPKII